MLTKGHHTDHEIEALFDIVNRMAEVQARGRSLMRRIRSWDDQ